ncbi:MAG: PilZ domain-containing protein [Desulfomonilaceae bacterium]
MGLKRQIPARSVVADIRAGITNAKLMKRYRISAGMLEKIFKKLRDANLITEHDLDGRMLSPQQGVVHDSVRQEPRFYTIMRLPISDMDNLDADCYVKDLSEQGLQIVNLSTNVGERKNFLIQASEFADVHPFSFEAECRWARAQTDNGRHLAGFEITRISDEDLQQLREFIRSATFSE